MSGISSFNYTITRDTEQWIVKLVTLNLKLEPGHHQEVQPIAQAITKELAPILAENKCKQERNEAKKKQHKALMKAYRKREKAAKDAKTLFAEQEPKEEDPEHLDSLQEVSISGFARLSPDLQVNLLQCIATTLTGTQQHRQLLHYTFKMQFQSVGTKSELRPEQVAARQCWLNLYPAEAVSGRDPFHGVISQWLKNNESRSPYGEDGRHLHYQGRLNEKMDVYQRLMGSAFLKELVSYFKSLSRDTVTKEGLGFNQFVYQVGWKDYANFGDDLRILASAPYFPLNLKLPERYNYFVKEFQTLLELLRTSQTKGMSQIDFSESEFDREQLQQLLTVVKQYNQEKRAICQLVGLKDKASEYCSSSRSFGSSSLLEDIQNACEENYRILHRQRILSLLNSGATSAPAPLTDSKDSKREEEKRPADVDDKKDVQTISAAARNRQPQQDLKQDEKGSGSFAPKRSLKALLAQIAGQKAQVHLQLQQQQEQQQQQEEEQQQAQHQDVNAGLQVLDEKDVIYYPRWSTEYKYSYGLTALQKEVLRKTQADDHIKLWFDWTLHGLKLVQNLDGFTSNALKKILQHVTLCHDGFDFDCLPQGLVVRQVTVGGKPKRILTYDPVLPAPPNPLAVKFTEPASDSKNVEFKKFAKLADSKDAKWLAQLMQHHYCHTRHSKDNHGVCVCMGCTRQPEQKDSRSVEEKTAEVFTSKQRLEMHLQDEVRNLTNKLEQILKVFSDPFSKRWCTFEYSLQSAFYRYGSWGENIYPHEEFPFSQEAKCIYRKWLSKLIKIKTGLQLPETDDEKAWSSVKRDDIQTALEKLRLLKPKNEKLLEGYVCEGILSLSKDRESFEKTLKMSYSEFKNFSREDCEKLLVEAEQQEELRKQDASLIASFIDPIFNDWQTAVTHYEQNLEDQRAACYRLLWGKRSDADIHQEFPIVARLSLRHLRLLLEVADKLDLEPGYQDTRKLEIVEALLNKFAQISRLDNSSRTFDLLFQYVLQPSDNWMTSLCMDDNQLSALNGICELSSLQRSNWNWLLERHGQSCGYADLHHLWLAFQHFNREYQRLTPGLAPFDLTKMSIDSVKNMYLFLNFLLIIVTNARSKEEQVELLRAGSIRIDQTGAYYASRHQKYYLVSEEMELGVTQAQIGIAETNIIKKQEEQTQAINYQVKREALIENPTPVNLYRYIGQQSHAALKFSFYRQCVEAKFKNQADTKSKLSKSSDKNQDNFELVLLVITSAHERAADFKEGPASEVLWNQLNSQTKTKQTQGLVKLLLQWHRAENFAALTFVEAATLIRLWQAQASGEKRGRLIAATKAIIDDPFYREAFLRVLREVYAQTQSTTTPAQPLLALDDYLEGVGQLKTVFVEEKEQKSASKNQLAGSKDVPDAQWREKLCWFVSRIAKEKKSTQWLPLVASLKKLHRCRTAEGHSVARRLVVMLGGLPSGSVNSTDLNTLFQAALSWVESKTASVTDLELFAWLQQQADLYKDLTYPVLRTGITHSPWVQEAIEKLLKQFPTVKGNQKEQLKIILERLWDPDSSLLGLEGETQTNKNAAITGQAYRFLKILLDRNAVWRRRSDDLLKWLAEHPQLDNYGFAFLEQLLRAATHLPFIDSELKLFKELLNKDDKAGQVKQLVDLQKPFCEAVESVCRLQTLNHSQRERMLSLLHCYAARHYDKSLLMDALTQFLIRFTEAYPAATDDMLTVLSDALKQGAGVLSETLKNLQILAAKVEKQESASRETKSIEKITERKIELKEGEEKAKTVTTDISKAKLLVALLHGLAGAGDAKSSAAILQQCSDSKTAMPIVEILARSVGRKDSGAEVQQFLDLLITLEADDQVAFDLLHTLSQHPPKLGIKNLLSTLKPEGQLFAGVELIQKLKQLEIDPHGLGFPRPQQDPFDSKRVADKIAQVTDPSRHIDGQPRRLFTSQQKQLLNMVTTVETLGTQPSFPNGEGADVPASQLTQTQFASLMREYRRTLSQEGISEASKQDILLRGISLMRQAMRRTPNKLFADDSQITAVCNTMVRHTDDNCFLQVDTGQGKTLVNAFNAACMWLLYGEVMVLTSDSGLAARDLANIRAFFELLGIPVAGKIITQTSTLADYCAGGINYTTCAGLDLSRHKTHLTMDCTALPAQSVGLVIDEVDDPFFDDHTDYRYTIPQIQSDSQGESPIAIFYQAMVSHFLSSAEFKRLEADERTTEDQAFQLLRKFLFNLPSHHPTQVQREALAGLLQGNAEQLRTWFISIVRAKRMRQGIGFTTVDVSEVIDGELREIKKVCPYSTSGRSNPAVQFSDGLQQLLQARKQQETNNPAFLIQQESEVLLSSNNGSIFNRGYARIVGATGTVGSAQEISRRLRRFPVRVNVMPPHQDKQRLDKPTQYCKDAKQHEAAIKAQIRECLADDPDAPILIITQHAQQLRDLIQPWVAQVLAEPRLVELKIHVQPPLTGEETPAQERDIVRQAGKARNLTIATSLAGRGFDVILDEELKQHHSFKGDDEKPVFPVVAKVKKTTGLRVMVVGPPANKRKELQYLGRAGRRGQPGKTYRIINQENLVNKDGEKVSDLEALYAKNEAHDYHEWQLKSYLGYVYDGLTPRFLAINQQVGLLQDQGMCSRWQFAQINLLKDLHRKWEDLKEQKDLEALWQKTDKQAYDQQLKECQQQLLDYACMCWNERLTQFATSLDDFKRNKHAEHEQAKKELAQREQQASKEQKDKNQESRAAQEAEKAWKSLVKQIDVVAKLVKEFSVTKDILAQNIPQEQLPYFYLPVPADADLMQESKTSTAQVQQVLALSTTEESKEFEAQLPTPTDLLAAAVQRTLQTLIKTQFLDGMTPADEIVGAVQEFLTRNFTELQGIQVTAETERVAEFKREDFMLKQAGREYSCLLTPVTIRCKANDATVAILAYLDSETRSILLPPDSDHVIPFNPEQHVPKPEPIQPSYANWYWLLLALLCLGAGATFTLTGLAATLGLPFVGLAHWGLITAFSLATLSTPGFWILAGIGAAYGFAAFLTVFALIKVGQAIASAIQAKQPDKILPGSSPSYALGQTKSVTLNTAQPDYSPLRQQTASTRHSHTLPKRFC